MLQNIWTFLRALFSVDERLARLEKQGERQDQKQNELAAELRALYLDLGRMAEREKWREEKFQHAVEMERAKLALEHSELEKERLRLELERERKRPQLPPATVTPSTHDNQS